MRAMYICSSNKNPRVKCYIQLHPCHKLSSSLVDQSPRCSRLVLDESLFQSSPCGVRWEGCLSPWAFSAEIYHQASRLRFRLGWIWWIKLKLWETDAIDSRRICSANSGSAVQCGKKAVCVELSDKEIDGKEPQTFRQCAIHNYFDHRYYRSQKAPVNCIDNQDGDNSIRSFESRPAIV